MLRHSLVIALAAGLVLAGCARDQYASSYDTFVAARQQDAVERGWIPDVLPESASDLREVHDPDDDVAVTRATLAAGLLPDDCTEVDEVGEPRLSPGWLPDDPATRGTPVRCGIWEGTVDGTTILLWTDRASEADAE